MDTKKKLVTCYIVFNEAMFNPDAANEDDETEPCVYKNLQSVIDDRWDYYIEVKSYIKKGSNIPKKVGTFTVKE